MITDRMKSWGVVFSNSFKRLRGEGFASAAATALASIDADEVFPLEYSEAEEIRRMARAQQLGMLAQVEDPDTEVERMIKGALKSCIDAHGPIDLHLIGSAAQRICGALKAKKT